MKSIILLTIAALCCGCGETDTKTVKEGVVVFVHGGGWTMRPPVLPAPSTAGLPELAARHGFEYRTITYPLATPENYSYPAAHRSVIKQLLEMRNEFRHTYVIGSSAGANIVALAALEQPSSMDKAALYYGVYDLPAMDNDFNSRYSNIYTSDQYAASPAHIGKPSVSVKLWHGSADTLVPYTQSTNYYDDAVIVDGAPHGFTLMDWTGDELEAFLFD